MKRVFQALFVSLLAVLVVAAPRAALAHDELESSDPSDGETVSAPLDEMTLTFTGQIAEVGAQVEVSDEAGEPVTAGEPQVDGFDLVLELDELGAGEYDVAWRVTSEDGHPVSGEFAFTVEAATEDGTTEEDTATAEDAATEDETTEGAAPGTQDEATEDEATQEEATQDEATEDEATQDAETATPADEDAVDEQAADGGVPVWVWVIVAAAVVGLGALLVTTLRRNRS